jgi:hypothetical protein
MRGVLDERHRHLQVQPGCSLQPASEGMYSHGMGVPLQASALQLHPWWDPQSSCSAISEHAAAVSLHAFAALLQMHPSWSVHWLSMWMLRHATAVPTQAPWSTHP